MLGVNLSSKRTLAFLVMVLLLVIGIQFVLTPFMDEIDRQKESVQRQQQTLYKIQRLTTQLNQLRSKGVDSAKGGVEIRSLPAWLEKKTVSAGLKKQVKQISPVSINKGDLYQQKTTLRMEGLEMRPLLALTVN